MTREQAIARIKPHDAELRAAGLAALYLFGSTARGNARTNSDVDLMCEIDRNSGMDLIRFAGIRRQLADFMSQPIDLVERHSMRPRVRARAEADMVAIF